MADGVYLYAYLPTTPESKIGLGSFHPYHDHYTTTTRPQRNMARHLCDFKTVGIERTVGTHAPMAHGLVTYKGLSLSHIAYLGDRVNNAVRCVQS